MRLSPSTRTLLERACRLLRAPPRPDTTAWANEHRYLPEHSADLSGRYDASLTPYMPGIHQAMDDPELPEVVVLKSAQVGWSDGGLLNYLFTRMDCDPCAMILLFPKLDDAKRFVLTKFLPSVHATPRIAALVDTSGARSSRNKLDHWNFPGGFLSLVTARATGSVKSTPAPLLAVEEPDDVIADLKGQGDPIYLLRERRKTFGYGAKLLLGGTPSVEGLSTIDHEYATSDRRVFQVPCHECRDAHVLDWANVSWLNGAQTRHEVYGSAQPETAVYVCPLCGVPWDDVQKLRNVREGAWRARSPEVRGKAGFFVNELYAPWRGSRLEALVTEYLNALYLLQRGDDKKMVVFVNSKQGKAYKYQTDAATVDELEQRAQDYAPASVPAGGLVLTVGVDVQHDRFEFAVRAWGREEESWLVYYAVVLGPTTDSAALVWDELERLVFGAYAHASGAYLRASAVSIDCSDGHTAENVYKWVRRVRVRRLRRTMAVKGASAGSEADRAQIAKSPKAVELDAKTKAARHGMEVWTVGTSSAKTLIDGRLKLDGEGAGRMHCYNAGPAYFAGLLSEVFAPSSKHGGQKRWQKKAGVRNEPLDCEVYALHAARVLNLHRRPARYFDAIEAQLAQPDLLGDQGAPADLVVPDQVVEPGAAAPEAEAEPLEPIQPTAPPPAARFQRRRRGGNWVTRR